MPLSHVFDTYVKTAQGRIMHFDVVLDEQDQAKALQYAKEWLTSIGHPRCGSYARKLCFLP